MATKMNSDMAVHKINWSKSSTYKTDEKSLWTNPSYTKQSERVGGERESTGIEIDGCVKDWEEATEVKYPSNTLLVGMTNSGKTNLVKLLLYRAQKKRTFHRIIVLCPGGRKYNKMYSFMPLKREWWKNPSLRKLDPKNHKHRAIIGSDYIMEAKIETIEEILAQHQRDPRLRTAVVLDDCLGIMNMRNAPILERLSASGRHSHISLFTLTQNISKVSTTLRTNCNTVYLSRSSGNSMRICSTENSQSYRSFDKFFLFFSEMIQRYGPYTMVKFDRTGVVAQDIIFIAPKAPKFELEE